MIYKRKCPNLKNNPNCREIIRYISEGGYYYSIKNNSFCTSCRHFGKPVGFSGHKHKKSTIIKMKKPKTQEHKNKIGLALKGRKFSKEHIKNLKIGSDKRIGKSREM